MLGQEAGKLNLQPDLPASDVILVYQAKTFLNVSTLKEITNYFEYIIKISLHRSIACLTPRTTAERSEVQATKWPILVRIVIRFS